MKKEDTIPKRIMSLAEAHRAFGLLKPQHPLVSLINGAYTQVQESSIPHFHVLSFYKIAYKPRLSGNLKYGQSYYDFDEGGLLFASPGQVIGSNDNDLSVCSEYTLLIHPDFFWAIPLPKPSGITAFSPMLHAKRYTSPKKRKAPFSSSFI